MLDMQLEHATYVPHPGVEGHEGWFFNEGPNAPVAPQDLHRAFGDQTMGEFAARAGISTEELAVRLAQALPHAVDALTPGGKVPGG